MKSAEPKPFNRAAQARVQALFRTCTPEIFLSQLATYFPRGASEQAAFAKYTGWALYDAGDYEVCRPHLMAAHRLSGNRSSDRPLTLGLLASTYLRTGHRARSTRLALRALSEGCSKDPGSLEAGLTVILAQSQTLSGNVVHSLEMYDRARALIDIRSPLWIPILHSRAKANLYCGKLQEAKADCREARMCESAIKQQAWVIGEMELLVALELGDVEQATEILKETATSFAGELSGRMQTAFTYMQAVAFNAQGRHEEAEPLTREILEHAVLGGRNSDVVAGASCSLTEALVGQNRFEEALETSRLAARAGRRMDWESWARTLRLQARCHLGLGSKRSAERVLREAEGLHACTQYNPERARLGEVARLLRPNSSRGVDLAWTSRSRGVWRLSLRSGQALVSCDTQLAEGISVAAGTDLPVLVEGETGTGKELVASLIHELSRRSRHPFVVIDCSSLPESLADAELFGVARGAYTGSHAHRAGLIAQADQGTLVLDELPELSNALQAKLLRVIQEGVYRRVGEDQTRHVRIRCIAVTNQDATALLQSGELRTDLFYRLSGHRLTIRPLRDRPEDIAPIANEIAKRSGLEGITMAAGRVLERHSWPGNVRQLEMVVRLAASSCVPCSLLGETHLAPHLFDQPDHPIESPSSAGVPGGGLRSNRLAGERAALERALLRCGGSVTKAAHALGITRQSFYQAMRRVGMKPGDWRDRGPTGAMSDRIGRRST
jgi:transcriptional regulator with AAA-type ATPase domain